MRSGFLWRRLYGAFLLCGFFEKRAAGQTQCDTNRPGREFMVKREKERTATPERTGVSLQSYGPAAQGRFKPQLTTDPVAANAVGGCSALAGSDDRCGAGVGSHWCAGVGVSGCLVFAFDELSVFADFLIAVQGELIKDS